MKLGLNVLFFLPQGELLLFKKFPSFFEEDLLFPSSSLSQR